MCLPESLRTWDAQAGGRVCAGSSGPGRERATSQGPRETHPFISPPAVVSLYRVEFGHCQILREKKLAGKERGMNDPFCVTELRLLLGA